MNNYEQSQAAVRQQVSHDEIARRAEELWDQYGKPQGRDEEIWLEAERQLRGFQQKETARASDAELPSSGTFGGPQSSSSAEAAGASRVNQSQESELMKQPATTTAARTQKRKAGGK